MAYLLLIITPLFWAGNVVSVRAIADQSDPLMLAFLRWSLALLLILPWWLPAFLRQWPEVRAQLGVLTLLSLLSVASFNTCIYLGVETTTATNAALLQAVIPILILLLNRIFYREQISALQWLGIAFSLTGVLVLIAKGQMQHLLQLHLTPGDLWIALAVISWAFYSVGLRHKSTQVEPFVFFGFSVLVGVLTLLPFALWEQQGDLVPDWSSQVWWVVAYIAIFPSILAYLFWNRGVAELGASTAGLFIYLIPVFGLSFAILFLKEQIDRYHLIGTALVVFGIWLAVFRRILHSVLRKPAN